MSILTRFVQIKKPSMIGFQLVSLLIIPISWLGFQFNSHSVAANSIEEGFCCSTTVQGQQIQYYLPMVQGKSSLSRNAQRVNVPYFADQIQFDETAIFWFGEVDPTDNYSDVRIGYTANELFIHVAIFDRLLWYDEITPVESLEKWDAVSLYLDLNGNGGSTPSANTYRFVGQLSRWVGRSEYQAAYQGNGAGWDKVDLPYTSEAGYRGNPNDSSRDSGWRLTYQIPFSTFDLTAPPDKGEVWGLGVVVHDRDDVNGAPIESKTWPSGIDSTKPATWGEMAFGETEQMISETQSTGDITIRHGLNDMVVEDGEVGGHTNCGKNLDRFSEWGDTNYASVDRVNIQNQYDVADFPCFSKFYISFPINGIPPGKEIISATLTMYQFGNAGGDEWGEAPATMVQVIMVEDDWLENSLTWNTAPQGIENVSRSWVPWIAEYPGANGVPRTWDVTNAVSESYSEGEPIRLALYSADSARHSGKYFWSSDYEIEESRPTLQVTWADK